MPVFWLSVRGWQDLSSLTEPGPTAGKQIHWSAREFPEGYFKNKLFNLLKSHLFTKTSVRCLFFASIRFAEYNVPWWLKHKESA